MSANYIALSAIPEGFNIDGHVVLITNGCNRYDVNSINREFILSANYDESVKSDFYNQARYLSDCLVTSVSEAIETKLKLKFSQKIWNKLLYYWAYLFISAAYYWYYNINKFIQIIKSPVFLTDSGNFFPYITHWYDMSITMFCDDAFNLHLYSDIIRFMKFDKKSVFSIKNRERSSIEWGNIGINKYNLLLKNIRIR